MIIIRNSRIAKLLKIEGIVLYPFMLFSEANPGQILMNHELIHVEQIKRLGVLRFYGSYLKEYLKHRMAGKSHHHAYLDISFEKEAYEKQDKV